MNQTVPMLYCTGETTELLHCHHLPLLNPDIQMCGHYRYLHRRFWLLEYVFCCFSVLIRFTIRSATVPLRLGFFAVLLFLKNLAWWIESPCLVGYVISQSVHMNLNFRSSSAMSCSVVVGRFGLRIICWPFILGIDISIPASSFCFLREVRDSPTWNIDILIRKCCIISVFNVRKL